MGQKFSKFMNALGGALNPQVFQINAANEAAEQAEINLQNRTQRDNDLKILVGGLSAKSALIQKMGVDDPRVLKIVEGAKDSIQNSNQSPQTKRNLMGAYGDELAFVAGVGRDKPKGKAFNAIDEKGNPVMAVQNSKGQIVDASTFEHKPNWTKAPTRAETGGAGAFTKKTQGAIEDQLLKGFQGKDRIKAIRAGFRPEFTEIGTKASIKFTAFLEKLGVPSSKASKKELGEFTTFARNTVQNLNQHIRDRTGAVMNAAETPRLMQEVPILGVGLLDGDSKTQFKAKMEGVLKSYEAAEARLLYVLENGLTPDKSESDGKGGWKEVSSSGLPLDDFKNLPPAPDNVDVGLWNKMLPKDRRRLHSLMNR